MGEVIVLSEYRRLRRLRGVARPQAPARAQFLFDLACPQTYLLAERVERAFHYVDWIPATLGDRAATAAARFEAEQRAAALRMPLVWPERFPAPVPAAMAVATVAARRGRGAAFVLAATRLAFCGGFDLEEPEILAEAAAAAGVTLDELPGDAGEAAAHAGLALVAEGVAQLPALRIGDELHSGERRVGEALAAARWARVARLYAT